MTNAERLDSLRKKATAKMAIMGHKLGDWDADTYSSQATYCISCNVPVGIDADTLLLRRIGDFPPEDGIYSAGFDERCKEVYS